MVPSLAVLRLESTAISTRSCSGSIAEGRCCTAFRLGSHCSPPIKFWKPRHRTSTNIAGGLRTSDAPPHRIRLTPLFLPRSAVAFSVARLSSAARLLDLVEEPAETQPGAAADLNNRAGRWRPRRGFQNLPSSQD